MRMGMEWLELFDRSLPENTPSQTQDSCILERRLIPRHRLSRTFVGYAITRR